MNEERLQWDLVNPEGTSKSIYLEPAARPETMEGKAIGLFWNSKPGGKEILNHIARLLAQRVTGIRFIRYWEAVPASSNYTGLELFPEVIREMVALKPDLVIASQGD